jgi:peptide/nickel transport system substrate-binding protein
VNVLDKKIIAIILIFISISCATDKVINENVFRYNEYSNISSLDPAFSSTLRNIWPCNQIFNGLVKMDEKLNVVSDIAEKWSISNDKKTYIFKLRDDVYFHKSIFFKNNTRKVNAYDFEYSFNRILDQNIASPGAWVMNNVESFRALNDSIFEIKLYNNFNSFIEILTMKYCSVVPKEVVENLGDGFSKRPIGTGPFKFKRWDDNIKMVLTKNENYFELDSLGNTLPYLDAISIKFIPDKKSEFMEFLSGNLDFISTPENTIIDQIFDINGNLNNNYKNKYTLSKSPYLNTEYIGFNTSNNLDQDLLLRKAINSAIDREKMIKFLRKNIGYPAFNGMVPNGLNDNFISNRHTKNIEEAKLMITEYKQTNNLNEIKLDISTDAQYLDVLEFVQSELKLIGITLNINIIPPSILRQGKATGKFELFRASWIADYGNPENYFSLFYSKNHTPNGPNYTYFSNKEYDQLYEKTLSENSKSSLNKIYSELEDIIKNYAPVIPLYYDMSVRMQQKNIHGLKNNPFNVLDLKKVYKN